MDYIDMSNDKDNPDKRKDDASHDVRQRKDNSAPTASASDSEDTIEIAAPGGALSASFVEEPTLRQQSEKRPKTVSDRTSAKPQIPQSQESKDSKLETSVKRLSSEQVQYIASRFSAEREVATETEREQLLKSLGGEGDESKRAKTTVPTLSPMSSSVSSKASSLKSSPTTEVRTQAAAPAAVKEQIKGPARGVAYFSGRTIKLGAAERMKSGDELIVGGNRYQLKPGKAKSGVVGYVVSVVLVVASALIGKNFLADGQMTGGEVIGVALNQRGLPYQDGAIVRLPELGFSTVTSPNGLFRFSNIPDGTYKLEYNLAGSLGGSQQISVRDNEASMISLDAPTERLAQSAPFKPKKSAKPKSSKKHNSTSATRTERVSSSSSSRGALAVTSAVSGAVVYIDNQKLGQINHTFRRMNTGVRELRIEKTGYKPYITEVTIKGNKIAKVDVTLVPLVVEQKPARRVELSASELFEEGREALRRGDNDGAVESFNQTLLKDPGVADAYFFRAEALTNSGNTQDAYLDYIRAGEIWSRQKRTQDALSAFDNAVEVSAGAAVAYKVRGDFYVNSKNREQGIKDYRRAIEADKKFFAAHLALGVALFESGSYRKADKELRRAQDYDDKNPILYHYLMLNSLAKNDLGDVSRYYKQFKNKATPAQMARFRSDNKLVAIRRIVKD